MKWILAALGLVALARACTDPAQVVFGTGTLDVTVRLVDGALRPDASNSLRLTAQCLVSGAGASVSPSRWRLQLVPCGSSPCNDTHLLQLSSTPDACGAPPCTLAPTNVEQDPAFTYRVEFRGTIPTAYQGGLTHYYARCWYVCNGDVGAAQNRAAASLTVDEPVGAPPAPPPPPPPPVPPPPPALGGFAVATIESPSMERGLIFAPGSNAVVIRATCRVSGRYARGTTETRPAQLTLCGSVACDDVDFDPRAPLIIPSTVVYDGDSYTATYEFTVLAAVRVAPVTYRYFSCLHVDSAFPPLVTRRAGASVDIRFHSPPPPQPSPAPSPPPKPLTSPRPQPASLTTKRPPPNPSRVRLSCALCFLLVS